MIKEGRIHRTVLVVCMALIVLSSGLPAAQDSESMKERALIAFRNADYPNALELLEEALRLDPGDAWIHYYLGYFYHYLCYDSVPLSGYGLDDSDLVLEYLRKALEIDPSLGDARYFVGAEYGVRARYALACGDIAKARSELVKGRDEGGFPPWMIEYGRNVLDSCDPDAILVTGGDADTNPVMYLQVVEGMRPDVTAVISPLLSRPWYIRLLMQGIDGVMPAAPISWTEYQVSNLHPYKWKKNYITADVTPEVSSYYGMTSGTFRWQVEPDLGEGMLSPAGALTADIVKTNRFRRPVHFSLGCSTGAYSGLNDNLQLCGMTFRLLPVKTGSDHPPIDVESTTRVFTTPDNFSAIGTLPETMMPRASSLLQNYRVVLLRLAHHHYGFDRRDTAREIFAFMEKSIPGSVVPYGNLEDHIQSLRRLIE
ncbi:MAG TPA: hypothetical protein VLA34_12525 [Candidatus Krumholzibacterium sp.]|nr:hypothetical protein [Candidatus Krumholzibacterium sp.]